VKKKAVKYGNCAGTLKDLPGLRDEQSENSGAPGEGSFKKGIM
jgi:hypothetical protein